MSEPGGFAKASAINDDRLGFDGLVNWRDFLWLASVVGVLPRQEFKKCANQNKNERQGNEHSHTAQDGAPDQLRLCGIPSTVHQSTGPSIMGESDHGHWQAKDGNQTRHTECKTS